MTTPTMPPFKEEPGLNAPKIGKRQVVRNVDIAFDEIQGKPRTLAGYGITDAVQKAWFDGKMAEMLAKIQALELRAQALENQYTQLSNALQALEARVSTLEQTP